MEISIFYFSGTGNTWWVSKKLKSIFNQKGHHAEIYSIEKNKTNLENDFLKIVDKSDLVGIGYPVYGSSVPKIMKDWVNEYLCNYTKSNQKKKSAFVFDTMVLFSGDTPLKMRKLLEKCNFKVKQAINIRMLSNLPQMPRIMTWEVDKQQEVFEKAEAKCNKLVNKILEEKKWVMRRDPFSRLLGWIQRLGLRLEGKKIKEWYEIDEERCTLCKKCVNYCPVDNLSIEENNGDVQVVFGDDCIYCMRCFNFCPENAIIIMERTRDTDRYRRFRGQIPDFKLSKIRKTKEQNNK
jgi:ferredoxin